MRKKLACGFAALSIFLVLSVACTPTMAATYAPGVPVGAVANYSFGQTNLNIGSLKTEVTGVSGAVVTFTKTEYYANGTQANSHSGLAENVSSQQGFAYMYYIAANLAIGDPLYSGSVLYKINGTLTNYNIAGGTRTVNYMNVTVMSGSIHIVAYWDKPTGLMVKFSYHQTGPGAAWWANFTLTSTSLWGTGAGGIPTLYLIGGGAAVAVVVAAWLLLRRRK
nr:hypothetical protein [Candidatus Njordarchaeum guaymaensis]